VQEAFGIVLVVVVVLAAVIAVASFAGSRDAYDQIGKGGFYGRDGQAPRGETGGGGAVSLAERDEELRQMLEARNARRERKGEAPLDVDAEIARLTAPAVDPALLAEVRELVEARNRRRVRQGKPELDVDAEVARTLRDLQG
jgi:hypothetical protein